MIFLNILKIIGFVLLGIIGLTVLIVHIVRKRKRKNTASVNQT